MEETIDGASATSTYEYDKQGRLVEYTPGFPAGYGTIVYEYNNLGQKKSMTVPLGVANKAKKICYSYDSEGKLVGTHVLPATATSSVSTATSDPGDLRFYYDDNGNRVKLINQDGDVYYFVYDPTASIPAVLVEIEATGSSQYLNIREPDGSLVSRETYNDSGTMTCHRTYHFDGLGSVVALSDENGTLTDKYTYDEWGNDPTHTDPDTGDAIGLTLDNPYQYVGKYGYYTHHQQDDLKLLQLGVRYYDPATGRFTQQDAIAQAASTYSYVAANPLRYMDPSGYDLGDMIVPDARICVDRSCWATKGYEDILTRMGVLPHLDNGFPVNRLPFPPSPDALCTLADPNPRQNCALMDALYIPPGVDLLLDGIPQRPNKTDDILKVSNGWQCTLTCDTYPPKLKCESFLNWGEVIRRPPHWPDDQPDEGNKPVYPPMPWSTF